MFYTIYKITNIINDKIYIGKHQTTNLSDNYMGSGKILLSAITKYGIENFKKEILHVYATEDEMNHAEAEIVTEEFCRRHDTYNLVPGGKGGFGFINDTGLRNGTENTMKNSEYREYFIDCLKRGKETQKRLLAENGEWAEKYRNNQANAMRRRIERDGNPFAGKSHSEETLKKLRKPKNVGADNSQYGTMWITNGSESKKINKIDPIPAGWKKGRKM